MIIYIAGSLLIIAPEGASSGEAINRFAINFQPSFPRRARRIINMASIVGRKYASRFLAPPAGMIRCHYGYWRSIRPASLPHHGEYQFIKWTAPYLSIDKAHTGRAAINIAVARRAIIIPARRRRWCRMKGEAGNAAHGFLNRDENICDVRECLGITLISLHWWSPDW